MLVTSMALADDKRQQELLQLHYVPSNHDTLSHLVWRYKYYSVNNDQAIDEFIGVTNCDFYSDYYDNDFLWQRIREGFRRELSYYSGTFPERYEFVGAIELGKYDFRRSAFELNKKYKLSNAGLLNIATHDGHLKACGDRYISKFPYTYVLKAENPFTIDYIPVPPSEAKELVQRLESRRYKNKTGVRLVIMRMRAKISNLTQIKGHSVYSQGVFKGELDEIAIFEDPKMENLIWKKNFKDLD
jgi:hypothetical protein